MKCTMTVQECEADILEHEKAIKSGKLNSIEMLEKVDLIQSLNNQIIHLQKKEIEELHKVIRRSFEGFVDATEVRNTGRKLHLVK